MRCFLHSIFVISVGIILTSSKFVSYTETAFYHSEIELKRILKRYQDDFPSIVKVHELGKSVENRTIWAVQISDYPYQVERNEPFVKLVAGIHGNEPIGRELTIALLQWLCENYNVDKEVTAFVNNHNLWLIPNMNPDGFQSSKKACCGSKGRENANGYDLNRNFPYSSRVSSRLQPETKVLMKFIADYPFVLSVAFHGGDLVVNYPFDKVYRNGKSTGAYAPDDLQFKYLSLIYAKNHPRMQQGEWDMCSSRRSHFKNGITVGALWYEVSGGMQDYNYFYSNCFEVTVELNHCKYPDAQVLYHEWNRNRNAIIQYLSQSSNGIFGFVEDSKTGEGIVGADIIVKGIPHNIKSTAGGQFFRILTPGVYTVTAAASGYCVLDEVSVNVPDTGGVSMNFVLSPLPGHSFSDEKQSDDHLSQYHTYEEVVEILKDLHKKYKNLTRLYSIGTSVKGLDLWVIALTGPIFSSSGPVHRPKVRLVGGMHGDEPVGVEVLLTFIKYICSNYAVVKRVTRLLDTVDLHIIPISNPDGHGVTSNQFLKTLQFGSRHNSNGKDLNRDFPFSPRSKEDMQPETSAIANWTLSQRFLLSASFHSGTLVMVYPFDDVTTPAPDASVFQYVGNVFVRNHLKMNLTKTPCPQLYPTESFPNALMSGASWYRVKGSLQDFSYINAGTLSFTVEISCNKRPPLRQLKSFWYDNKPALLAFVEMVNIGVKGRIFDRKGKSLFAEIVVVGISTPTTSTPDGFYWKLLPPGKYQIIVSATGYVNESADVEVPKGAALKRDFYLCSIEQCTQEVKYYSTINSGQKQASQRHTYEDLLLVTRQLQTQFPKIVQISSLGSSKGYRQMPVISISSRHNLTSFLPHIAIVGDVHSGVSTATVLALAVDFAKNYSQSSHLQQLLKAAVIHFIPTFYPDDLETCLPDDDFSVDFLSIKDTKWLSLRKQTKSIIFWLDQQYITLLITLGSRYSISQKSDLNISTEVRNAHFVCESPSSKSYFTNYVSQGGTIAVELAVGCCNVDKSNVKTFSEVTDNVMKTLSLLNRTVSGTILDGKKQIPLDHVSISFGENYSFFANFSTSGFFSFILPRHYESVVIQKNGYEVINQPIPSTPFYTNIIMSGQHKISAFNKAFIIFALGRIFSMCLCDSWNQGILFS